MFVCVCVCVCAFGWQLQVGILNCCVSLQQKSPVCVGQHTATHCDTPQHTATRCNKLQHTISKDKTLSGVRTETARTQRAATHCNILQHNATHRNTRQYAATHIQHTSEHFNAPSAGTRPSVAPIHQPRALSTGPPQCNILQHTVKHSNTRQHAATHAQHTATHHQQGQDPQ